MATAALNTSGKGFIVSDTVGGASIKQSYSVGNLSTQVEAYLVGWRDLCRKHPGCYISLA